MMLSLGPVVVGSATLIGVDAVPIHVEATMQPEGGPARILGSADSVVREACVRVLGAFRAQGLPAPRGSPLLNLAPADVPKTGSAFDLPIALAIAGAGGVVAPERLAAVAAFGEVTLEGRILPAQGAVAAALACRERGWTTLYAHPDDARRAAVVRGVRCVPVGDLREAVTACADPDRAPAPIEPRAARDVLIGAGDPGAGLDVADIRGHETPKRALLVAAAGRHDLLLVGPPGSGKSALARRFGALLPQPDDAECLDVLRIHTARAPRGTALGAGARPFRAPHHTSSAAAVLGGGPDARPGEVTLAHHGVLFLDELPEFRREVLEGLRQPLEDRAVTIGRARRTVTLPADFQLVAAMNPCPCGHAGSPLRPCSCPAGARARYLARVSGPLLDRFDLRVEVPALPPEALAAPPDPDASTAVFAARVQRAVARQRARNPGAVANGRLPAPALAAVLGDDPGVERALGRAMRAFGLSGRGRVRLLRSARTLADLDGAEEVAAEHVLEAARLRAAFESR